MRFIQLSIVLPVLALVSANLGHHHQNQRNQRRHELVARQRSSAGVLDPLFGGEEESSTVSNFTYVLTKLNIQIAQASAQSTVLTSSTRTSIIPTEDDTTISPNPTSSSTSSLITGTTSTSSRSSLASSSSSMASSSIVSASNSCKLTRDPRRLWLIKKPPQ
jgi:hypothetical protein